MTVDSLDPTTGHPIFLESGAVQLGADHTAVAAFAGKVGTRLIGTTAERTAYAFARRGLEWYDTTRGRLYLYGVDGWALPAIGGALYGTTAQRIAAFDGLAPGDLWYDSTTESLWRREGAVWREVSAGDSGWINQTVTSGSGVFRARKIGKIIYVHGNLSGVSSTANVATSVGTIDSAFRPTSAVTGAANFATSGAAAGIATISAGTGLTQVLQGVGTRSSVIFNFAYPVD